MAGVPYLVYDPMLSLLARLFDGRLNPAERAGDVHHGFVETLLN
jgi:hypothetical protein